MRESWGRKATGLPYQNSQDKVGWWKRKNRFLEEEVLRREDCGRPRVRFGEKGADFGGKRAINLRGKKNCCCGKKQFETGKSL